jgi:polar amino acid transport system substrate-binding protein
MRANDVRRVASTLVLVSAALAVTAVPLCAQQSGQASKQPGGYASPEGVPPRPAAVDIDPVYAKPAIDTLATIRRRGVLRVGVAPTEPMVMHDAKGELVGFSIDLGRKLAEDLGVRVAFVETSWSQIVPDLLGNHFDLIASGLWITPARALVVNFSESTAIEAVHLVAGKQLAGTMKTREDFNRPDVRIVVYAGTVQESIAASLFPRAQVLKVEGDEDQLAPVLQGKAHATVLTTASPGLVVRSAPDRLFLPLDGPLQATSTALAVRKGDADFLNFLNSWLLFQRQSGFLAERSQYWFKGTDWLKGM